MSVQHPCDDKHALILAELSDECSLPCHLCELHFSGPTYCCWDCGIFLHKSCAELPLKTKHPAHPEHPTLSLTFCASGEFGPNKSEVSSKFFIYKCDDCTFQLELASIVLILDHPKEEEEGEKERLRFFFHDHPLTYFLLNRPVKIGCRVCGERIYGPLYGCIACSFFLHESCALLPEEIEKHPFHPQHHLFLTLIPSKIVGCSACIRYTFGARYNVFAYKCRDCIFGLDVKCTALALPSKNHQEGCVRIEHFSHKHPLAPFSVKMENTYILCKSCNERVSGEVYGCPDCIFFLHRSCLEELHQEMVHFLHPDHPLVFKTKAQYREGKFFCNSCSIQSPGFVFSCERCHFDLDPVCAFQTLAAVKAGASIKISHFSHDHKLTISCYPRSIRDWESFVYMVRCEDCKGTIKGLVYRCYTCNTNQRFLVHKKCAELPWRLEHPLHPQHPLTLRSTRCFRCEASQLVIKGIAYGCEECRFFLSTKAAFRLPTLKHKPHEHDLTYFENSGRDPCNYCGKRCNVDSYSCVACNFNVHYNCIRRLPLSIKHVCHYHPLPLFDKYVVPYREDQYCDACETTRRPDRAVYFCEECDFAAHIGCVVPWVEIEECDLEELKEIECVKAEIMETGRKLEVLKEKLKKLTGNKDNMSSSQEDDESLNTELLWA